MLSDTISIRHTLDQHLYLNSDILENCFGGPSETRTHDPLRAKQVL